MDKRIKIGIELTDANIKGVDLSHPEDGNPGVGGSEYLFAMLGYYLHSVSQEFDITYYHYTDTKLPKGIRSIVVNNNMHMLDQATDDQIDILIHQVHKEPNWYDKLQFTRIKDIPWAHTYLEHDELVAIKGCSSVKRVVFVGKEEYDAYIDDDVIFKSSYIYNMINTKKNNKERNVKEPTVTYVGSLVPAKGFHVLAKIWSQVLEKVPNAQLNVIGTGKVYDRNAILGKYGIAQEDYENSFMHYLTDKNGVIFSSVHFLGLLGKEKDEVFTETSVGVVNPTALSETFCISAIEMELCGIPVVSKRKFGLYDTIKHGKTGLLFNSNKKFVAYLVKLMSDCILNDKFGSYATVFVKETFEAEKLIKEWENLIKDVNLGKSTRYLGIQGNYRNDYKWLKIINHCLRFGLHLKFIPSFEDGKYMIKNILGKAKH